MNKVRYNKELLNSCMERDGATLLGEYENLNRDCKIKFICSCGKEGEKFFKNVIMSSGVFCKLCSKSKRLDKVKATNLEKLGVEYPTQSKEVRDKVKATNLEKLGVEYPSQSKEVRDKIKNTNLKNLGVEHPMYSDKVKNKLKEVFIQKYGVDNPSKSIEIQEKKKETLLLNYGVLTPLHSQKIKDKIKDTNLKNYGVENPSQNKNIKNKKIETSLLNYGVEYPMQNPEIAEKCLKRLYSKKDYNLPSGKIIKVQGYETFALDKIIKEWNIEEDDIVTDRTKVPEIWWNDSNNIRRRYYVDIFIPSKHLVIEVKSTWTIKLDIENIKRKNQASKELGYNTLLWVFGEKGNLVKEYDNCPIEV